MAVEVGASLAAGAATPAVPRALLDRPARPRFHPVLQPYAWRAFGIGVWIVGALVVVQFLLAGLGVFVSRDFFVWHASVNGAALFLLPLVLVLLAWLGEVPRRLSWLALAITGLVLLQSLLLLPYHMAAPTLLRAISGLHVVNALVIAWAAMRLIEQTRELSSAHGPAESH
jgi:Family of unknown function (DUF6220)